MSGGSGKFEDKLRQLSLDYYNQLPNRILKVRGHWQAAKLAKVPMPELEATYREIHSISGSASTFGLPQVSMLAKKMEQMVQGAIKEGGASISVHHSVEKGLEHLFKIVSMSHPEETALPIVKQEMERPVPAGRDLLFWLGQEREKRNHWVTELEKFYFQIRVFTEVERLAEVLGKQSVQGIVVEFHPAWQKDGLLEQVLSKLANRGPAVPLILLMPSDPRPDLLFRCFQAGANGWLEKPPDWVRLIRLVDQFIYRANEPAFKLLLIDDDVSLVNHIAEIMRKTGMEVVTITEPKRIFEVLETFRPDLILLDLYMPGVSGIEISKILHQIKGMETVPIVYLSSEHEVNKHLEALDAGAEDFLLKPIKYRFLYFSLLARMKRARDMQRLLRNDSLTLLPNHTTIYEKMTRSIAEARKNHESLAFALICLDRFGAVNDHYGPLVGDQALQILAAMLDRRFRKLGMVGRFAGANFAILFPNQTAKAMQGLFEETRKDFQDFPLGAEEQNLGSFTATLSIAVVGFPEFENPAKMLQAAERGLQLAKSQGGNRVIVLDQNQRTAPASPTIHHLDHATVPSGLDALEDEPLSEFTDVLEVASALGSSDEEVLDTDILLEDDGESFNFDSNSMIDWSGEFPADQISGSELRAKMHPVEVSPVHPFGRGRKILVVDDEFLVVEALTIYLEELGFVVTKALTGEEGFIKAKASPPDLIITDLLMFPGIHGFELCKKIRKDPVLSDTKIIVTTAIYRNYRHRMEAKESGANEFLEKPISYDELRKAIEKLIGQ